MHIFSYFFIGMIYIYKVKVYEPAHKFSRNESRRVWIPLDFILSCIVVLFYYNQKIMEEENNQDLDEFYQQGSSLLYDSPD